MRNLFPAKMHLIDFKIVYTVSDKGTMIEDVVKSIRTVRRFIEKEHIIVFYTPPRSENNFQKLAELATVIKAKNITKPFVFQKKRGFSRYGEKIHVCDVECPNVIFLDADTIVKKDISMLLEGDFDFSARSGSGNVDLNKSIWTEMFQKVGKQPILMPNTGFMIFKNYCHRQIKKEWLEYINDPSLPNPHPYSTLKEQYALALAVSGKKIKWMTHKEHAFVWKNEYYRDAYVIHGKHESPIEQKELQRFWNRRAEEPDDFRRVCTFSSPSFNKFLNFIQRKMFLKLLNNIDSMKNKKILEIGCGIGRWSTVMLNKNVKYVGIDFSTKMLKLAKIRNQSYDFINNSVSMNPFRANAFDIIFSITVLHHIPHPQRFETIKEMARLVKPKGHLIILEDIKGRTTTHFSPNSLLIWKDMFEINNCKTLLTIPDKYYKSVINIITKFSIGRWIIKIMEKIKIVYFVFLLLIEKIASIILPSKYAHGVGILFQKTDP